MKPEKLTDAEIEKYLKELPSWNRQGAKLYFHRKFKNFIEPLKYVNRIGKVAEKLDHHPDIRFGWGYVEIFVTTHSAGGITVRDFELANEIDTIGN